MHLQFKFDPLPAGSVKICVFYQRWIKSFDTQLFGHLCIKYGIIIYKIDFIQFCNKYIVGPSLKTHFGHSKMGKCYFFAKNSFQMTPF